jgi:hypothetical protein
MINVKKFHLILVIRQITNFLLVSSIALILHFRFFVRNSKLCIVHFSIKIDLHTERFISLLKSTHGEELERVDVMPEVELDSLADVKTARRNKVFTDDFAEGGITGTWVDQKLSVLRETFLKIF